MKYIIDSADHLSELFHFVNSHKNMIDLKNYSECNKQNNKNKNETEEEYRFKLVRKSTDEYLKKFLDQDVNQSKSRELWCAICLEEMSGFDKIRQLKCSHHFHQDCIEHWLAKNLDELSCPLCRTSLYPPLEEE